MRRKYPIVLGAISGACLMLVAMAFAPVLLPCGARPLTAEEKNFAFRAYAPLTPEYVDSWRVPCGASTLGIEDRVQVARILRRHGSSMTLAPGVLRTEFERIYFSPSGAKAYEFLGRTLFFRPLVRMRATETCGTVIGAAQSFGEGLCP